jgi:hypothetical protein
MINKACLHCLQFEGFVLHVPFIFTVYTACNIMSTVSPAKPIQIRQFHYHKVLKLVKKPYIAHWWYSVNEKCC